MSVAVRYSLMVLLVGIGFSTLAGCGGDPAPAAGPPVTSPQEPQGMQKPPSPRPPPK